MAARSFSVRSDGGTVGVVRAGLLVAIVVGALALRLWGIGFGLPRLYHPDEPAYVLQALAVGRGLPGGLTFANPPAYKYLLLGEYGAVYALDRLRGTVGSTGDFVEQFRADPTRLYLIARVTSAVLGTATVLAVAALAKQVAVGRVAPLSGAFAAVAYLLVRESHFGVNDALVTLLVALGLLPCVAIARGKGRCRHYIAAGVLTGLAFAAKYHGVVLLVPLLLAHFGSRGRLRNLALAFLACASAAVVAFPSLVTEAPRVIGDVYLHLYLGARGGYDGLEPNGGYRFYAGTLALGLGAPLLLASLAGLLERRQTTLVLASVPVTLILVLGAQQMYFARFILPALPPLIVLATLAVDALWRTRVWLGVATALVVIAPTLADSLRFDVLLTRDDTRALADGWIAANLPPGAHIAADAPPLGPKVGNIDASGGALYDLSLAGVDYVVTSSFTADARAIDLSREARRVHFNADLAQHATRLAEFRPSESDLPFAYDRIYGPFDHLFDFERPGPAITIYRLDRSP